MLSLLLFGSPVIERDGHALALPRRKNRALLYYVAAHAKPLTRQQLLTFFFADHERSAAQSILRTMLHDLRRAVPGALVVDPETVGLAAEVFVDVRVFESALARPAGARPDALASALELYRGDFLAGFALNDSPEFDDWLHAERNALRGLAVRGWMRAAELHEQAGEFEHALQALERCLALDALSEQAQRAAMRIQYWNGDRPGAIRRFEQLERQLDAELGVPPMQETRAVYDAIVTDTMPRARAATEGVAAGSRSPRLPSRPRPGGIVPAHEPLLPFTGRELELGRLDEIRAQSQLIWIEGEPGIGKTRLAEEFIRTRYGQGEPLAIVLRGAAHELEQNLPYQPWIDTLRGLFALAEWRDLRPRLELAPAVLHELARLVPELGVDLAQAAAASVPADEARMWHALHQLLAELARWADVVVVLDDVHWADAATIGVIGYLARRALAPSMTLIVTARPGETPETAARLVQAVTREGRMARVLPHTLIAQELHALAAQIAPQSSRELAVWLNENTEGNPFFINELVRYAFDSGLVKADGTLDLSAAPYKPLISPTIQNLIQSRLLRLDDAARRLVQTACVIGREFDFALIQHATGMAEEETLEALAALKQAGLVLPASGDLFRFDHQLTVQVAYQDLDPARQRVLHRRVADSLVELNQTQLEAVAGLVVRHLRAAQLPERAAQYALPAGKHAKHLAAWSETITFFELALEGAADPPRRAALLLEIGDAHFHRGEFASATKSFTEAFDLARAGNDLALAEAALLALNQSLLPQARYAQAVALSETLVREGPAELAFVAEFTWGTALAVESAHPAEAERHLRAAEDLLDAPRAYVTQIHPARFKYQLAAVLGQQGKSISAIESYRQALELLEQAPDALDLTRMIMLHNNLAYHLHLVGDYAQAWASVHRALELAQTRGSNSHLPYLLSTSGEIALAEGELEKADEFFQRGLEVAEKVPIPERIAGLTANLGRVALARGDRAGARERFQAAMTGADAIGNGHLALRIRIWLAPLLPPDEANARLDEAEEIAQKNGFAGLLQEIAALRARAAEATRC